MSEINDAYERIKSGDTGQSPYGNAAYGSSAPSGTYTRNGTNYYYRYADINDFDDIFKAFFGGFGFNMHTSDTMSAEEAFERIDNYLRSGDYRNAAAVLNRFLSPQEMPGGISTQPNAARAWRISPMRCSMQSRRHVWTAPTGCMLIMRHSSIKSMALS